MIPTEIVFKNMDRSDFVAERVEKEAAKLERYFERIGSLRVVIETGSHSHRKGALYQVKVHITVPPGRSIDIDHSKPQSHSHEDVYVAVRDAFDAARRRLQDYVRETDHRAPVPEPPLLGRVVRLVPGEDGYGFVATSDGSEYYFHHNSVHGGDFRQLREGSEVRIMGISNESALGPQAATVVLLNGNDQAGSAG